MRQATLMQALGGESRKILIIEADGDIAAGFVLRVMDISRSTGAQTLISLAGI
jgi:hypothetical protein